MHVAYNIQSVVKAKSIQSLAAYANNVIFGNSSGQLFMYTVDEQPAKLLWLHDNFDKKAIAQIAIAAPEHLLFVLSDEIIHIFDTAYGLRKQVASTLATKGCTLFSLDVKIAESSAGEKTTLISICCAIKRQLRFFYWKVNKLKSLKYSIELKDSPKALSWVDDSVCVGFRDEYIIYNISRNKPKKFDGILKTSRMAEPCICLLKNNTLCVTNNNFLLPIDQSLVDCRRQTDIEKVATIHLEPMTWGGKLVDLVWDEPFVLGCLPHRIEVRSLNNDALVQSIPLNEIKYLVRSAQGTIFAASSSELWCIRMEDVELQVQELLQQKKFQLAIELTSISSEPSEVKSASIRQIHMRSAKEFFKTKLFAEAMSEFIKGQADPYDVIRLYPNLWPEQAPGANEHSKVKQHLRDCDLKPALIALIDYLKWARLKEKDKAMLSILSTTLLKVYLQTNDALVPHLLGTKQCHFEESERTLHKYNKTAHLLILYEKYRKHKKALELLQAQSTIEGSSLYGYEHIIQYLQGLGSSHLPLILEFANWVLQQQPVEGLQIFTKDLIEVENLPRANVLDFLLSSHRSLVIPYLEHVIHVWKDPNTLIHNVLIKQYREKIQSIMNEKVSRSESEGLLKTYREKLYDLLKNSNNYSPDVVLKDFPINVMLEERALILGRLKKHEKVLAIYIQILGDIERASQYCEENYDDDNNMFLLLLKTILSPLKQPPYEGVTLHPEFLKPNHDIVLNLLNKYAAKISPCQVWPYLPDDMPMHRLHNYLDTNLRMQMATAHHNAIKEALVKAEYLRLQQLSVEISVEINNETRCRECNKGFHTQNAFRRYPNGQVAHLNCRTEDSFN